MREIEGQIAAWQKEYDELNDGRRFQAKLNDPLYTIYDEEAEEERLIELRALIREARFRLSIMKGTV